MSLYEPAPTSIKVFVACLYLFGGIVFGCILVDGGWTHYVIKEQTVVTTTRTADPSARPSTTRTWSSQTGTVRPPQ